MVRKIKPVGRLKAPQTPLVLKHNTLRCLDRAQAAVKGRILRQPPLWTAAVEAHPPNDSFAAFRAVMPAETGAFAPAGAPPVLRRPARIEYPEDAVRDAFYAAHPFELTRPRSVVQTESALDARDWAQDIYGGRPELDVTGENVVQRTMALAAAGARSEQQAYETALGEFYAARAAEERARVRAQDLAARTGASIAGSLSSLFGASEAAVATRTRRAAPKPLATVLFGHGAAGRASAARPALDALRPATAHAQLREDAALEDDQAYRDQLQAEQRARHGDRTRMAAYDLKNL